MTRRFADGHLRDHSIERQHGNERRSEAAARLLECLHAEAAIEATSKTPTEVQVDEARPFVEPFEPSASWCSVM